MERTNTKLLITAFEQAMVATLPQFERRPGRIGDEGDAVGFVWRLTAHFELRILLQPFLKQDRFAVELAWGRGALGTTWRSYGPRPLPAREGYGYRLAKLWWDRSQGPTEMMWSIGEPTYFTRRPNVRAFEDPATAARDAVKELVKYGIPYFRSLVAENEPGALDLFDSAVATSVDLSRDHTKIQS